MKFEDFIIFLFPAYFVFVGFISNMIKDKPIDKKYGYRSELSTKSKQNWYFANDFMAKGAFALAFTFIILGLILNNFVDMYRYRRILFIIIEFMSYVILGIILENRLKIAHKK
ncbi:SdpI family protein [uncultured Anaerococcus sp.]|uniref:SdpI family protein n=1 Tax=uncultured Anaerococcus sp. TaxID=293428 RepID=UPI00288AB9EF|nr:SdpI family protein [uncultured Anaerococcus sp.]